MHCPSCGTQLRGEDRYCGGCGRERHPSESVEAQRAPTGSEGRRAPWGKIAIAAGCFLLLAGVGVLVASNWAPEEEFGGVEAPAFDPYLAGGGLSSGQLGSEALVDSLETFEPIGYEILRDAVEENVISQFRQVPAPGRWTTEFRADGSDFRLRFKLEKTFLLNHPESGAGRETSAELFSIARRYGYYDDEELAALDSLEGRTDALDDAFYARELTNGVAEPDLDAQGTQLAADWDSWIQDYGEWPPATQWAEANRKLALVISEVSGDPTNRGVGRYNRARDGWVQASRTYRRSL